MNFGKFIFIALISVLRLENAQAGASFKTATGFHAQKYTDVSSPRGLFLDSQNGDILVLSKASSEIFSLSETTNKDGSVTVKQHVIVNGSGLSLSHGITQHDGYVYASSATSVYRWKYEAGSRELATNPPQIVINGLPSGGYSSRSLVFDVSGNLYVSIGSLENVDPNSSRARILRFSISNIPDGGIDANDGVVFSDGLRNTVGFAFDASQVLWGADNGVESLSRPDLGGDIHNENPAEELNKLEVGRNYGYPYCFSSYKVKNETRGTQYAWPTFLTDGTHDDEWCRVPSNNTPPALAMPAHTAPLGIAFYDGKACSAGNGAFPCAMKDHAFIAHHGSTNSVKRVGYQVTRVSFSQGSPSGEILDVIYESNVNACDPTSTCFRPVNAIFDKGGHLVISTDTTGEIFRVFYNTQPPPINGSAIGLMLSKMSIFLAFGLSIRFAAQ